MHTLRGGRLRPQSRLSQLCAVPLLPLFPSSSFLPPAASAQHAPILRISSTEAVMIRREPTTLYMTDADVRQVRDALIRQKNEKLGIKPGVPLTPAQAKAAAAPSMPYHHAEEQKKKREAMTRDERLGLR
ncbi:hypothetical protein C8Q74DRAFT_740254 [Fomes fomentarius]|nr:hypothetical protein C8Q74DRAFT_740254 [Fomes fomentarius]